MNFSNFAFSLSIAAVERPLVMKEREMKGAKGTRRCRYSTAAFTKANYVI